MPRCVSGCATSSVSPSRTRIDEAGAGPRVVDDEWVLGVSWDRCSTLVYTYDYDEA